MTTTISRFKPRATVYATLAFLKCRCTCCSFKNFLNTFASPCRTLDISTGLYALSYFLALFCGHRRKTGSGNISGVSSEFFVCADEYNGRIGTVMTDFGFPLVNNAVQTVGIGDTEAQQYNIGARIIQRPVSRQHIEQSINNQLNVRLLFSVWMENWQVARLNYHTCGTKRDKRN